MKKTVNLTNLIKAKNDLELFIKIDQMKRLQKLFDPTFDVKDLNSKIETKEDQLIIIKEAISLANATNKDEDGNSLNHSIYLLSKYNRFKADCLTQQDRLTTNKFLSKGNDQSILLKEIKELNELIEKETDKKIIADHLSTKNKLKRSLTKSSSINKSYTDKLLKNVTEDLTQVEEKITLLKTNLTRLNLSVTVEVEIADEFELVVK